MPRLDSFLRRLALLQHQRALWIVALSFALAAAALPDDVGSLSMAELKAWVTEHRLEDEAFMRLAGSRAKKADYVAYVQRRAAGGR